MNVYDSVNNLAKDIKESEEYLNYKNAKQAIGVMPEYHKKIAEFERLRYEEQLETIKTGKKDNEKIEVIQQLYKEMIEIPEIQQYFDAQLKFNILLGDVNKAISQAVQDVM